MVHALRLAIARVIVRTISNLMASMLTAVLQTTLAVLVNLVDTDIASLRMIRLVIATREKLVRHAIDAKEIVQGLTLVLVATTLRPVRIALPFGITTVVAVYI